jgi:NAD+ kinase
VSSCREEAANIHITVADAIIEKVKSSGRDVRVKRDYQLIPEDFEDRDVIFSLGGDGTFLKTASMISDNTLPVLGVNTDPTRSVGHLCSRKVSFHDRNSDIDNLFKYVDRENFEFMYR